ncbi:hypothetical protein ZWY2020_039112 [Hordeum vulgare]|nr:hypothetical protein ZWY2020_039112 [Hordeum vulgare]
MSYVNQNITHINNLQFPFFVCSCNKLIHLLWYKRRIVKFSQEKTRFPARKNRKRFSIIAVEALLDHLDTVAAAEQPYDDASSSQQQFTVDSYGLSGPLFLAQPTTTGASTYLHAAIAAGGSPEHRQIRLNDALHYISHMLMEDVDGTLVSVCQEEASWTSRYRRLSSTRFSDNGCSSYSVLQPLTYPLSLHTCNRSLISLKKRPLINVGPTCSCRSDFPALRHQRGVEEALTVAPSIDKMVICLENGILSITKPTSKAKENTIFKVADPREILPPREGPNLGKSESRFGSPPLGRHEGAMAPSLSPFTRTSAVTKPRHYGRKSFGQIARPRIGMTKKGRSKGDQKVWQRKQPRRELVDLKTLLVHWTQAVAEHDDMLASELLKKIRQHSSADGDCTQRLAFYLADGLEARLAGIGSQVYCNLMERRTSSTDSLDACSHFLASFPFDRTSHYFASQAILDVSQGQPRVHIIDFGIGFDLQLPLIIQRFSQQEEGVPKLRITGIDVPQQGFHPCEMIEETGKRLADYAHMFKVPFQYHGIATSRWDTIKIQDLKLTKLNNAISQTG